MSEACRICLEWVDDGEAYHARCVRNLFGSARPPKLEIEIGRLHTAALAMVGHTSLSGAQKKISVNLSADRETLQVAAGAGRFILKPQTEAYPSLPENEHVTTRLAQLVGIDVGRFGLVSLKDGSLAFIVRRFDRLENGKKLRQEDFCQLAELSPKEKYESSAERSVKLVRRFASEPLIEIQKFYRLLVFVWWSGNGDMHLKNFSLLVDEQGVIRLTPAYDLVCTRLVIPNDPLALSILGKKDNLDRKHWLAFAEYCQLPAKAAARVLDAQTAALPEASGLLERCFLPAEQKAEYRELLEERTARLAP
ncbi:MAG: HipA domain-containing protein [Pirellulales bacterium]